MGSEQAVHDEYDVLLIDDVCSFLTPRLVQRLREQGREVVGVYSPDDGPDAKRRLLECGVTDVIEADASADEFLATAAAILAHRRIAVPDSPRVSPTFRIGVLGSGAGTGVTEVSIALASHLASRRSAVLVDLNQVWPGIAQRLDLSLHPNLRTAVDLAHHSPGRLPEAIHQSQDLAVVAGLANPDAGQEVSLHELRGLLEDLGTHGYEFLVADLGSVVGDSTPWSLDFGMLVVVGTANPVGLTRLVRTVQRLLSGPHQDILVAVNRVPAGGHRQSEIRSELHRSLAGTPVVLLPGDPRIESAAWNGVVTDSGRFNRAMREVAGLLVEATRA
jgi:MinD-like ATPase involved in chromosome partitioning or flagellar assembly